MPKDYRERRIDIEPPRVVLRYPKKPATSTSDPLPPGTYSTVVTLAPGDAVLWFLRLATSDSYPSGRMVSIVDTVGGAVSHTYTSNPSAFVDFITLFQGDFAFDGAGESVVTNDTIYCMFDQFDGFTSGDYRLSWDPPATARANVEGAILLSGVDTTSQGSFYYGPTRSPTWVKYEGPGGSGSFDHFPVSVPTAANSIVYGIWDMSGSVSPPADYVSVPGTTHLSYTYNDPTEPPVMTQSVVSRVGVATGSTLSASGPTVGGSGGGAGTSYRMSAIVLNSATGITYTTVTFEA